MHHICKCTRYSSYTHPEDSLSIDMAINAMTPPVLDIAALCLISQPATIITQMFTLVNTRIVPQHDSLNYVS